VPELDPAAIERLRRLGGDALTGKMASLFLGLAPERLRAAHEGLIAGDHDAIRRAAHSLKSSAGNIGAGAILEDSGRLEDAAESGAPMDQLEPLYAALEADVEAARPELVDLAAKEESPS
jgi:HPt (histidine-containing phosphotransfer) domain-containing protein